MKVISGTVDADTLRSFARQLLGPLYTAADVDGAIEEFLKGIAEEWSLDPGRIIQVPEPEPLINYVELRQAITDGIANGISEAEIWKRNRG